MRALRIYSSSFLELELGFIKSGFLGYGYPLEIIQSIITTVQLTPKKELMFGPEKSPVYLKLPYIGIASKRFRTAVKGAVHNGYYNARA